MGLLIDVRTPEEYQERHASGAASLPLTLIQMGKLGFLKDAAKDTKIELYCHSGARAEQARQALLGMGFLQITNVGGLADVEKRGATSSLERYWFRPVSVGKWFMVYYPTSWHGWAILLLFLELAGLIFSLIDSQSHSGSDTLLGFVPWGIALLAVFDLVCLRNGEYPVWWPIAKKGESKEV